MGETIIDSNQLRASGDTSTQTLIGANQVRQSGDSSSQTLLNKNQIAQSQGTLNAEIVGTPTISDDFILSNFDDSNYLKFHPANPYFDGEGNKDYTIVTKFKVADLTKSGCLFMCSPDQKGFKISYGQDGSGQGGMSFLVTDYYGNAWANTSYYAYIVSNIYTTANQWIWVKVEIKQKYIYVYTSLDGINYTEKYNAYFYYNASNFVNLSYEQVGTGDSNNTIEIDLKETKYYIDDVLSWEAVSF